MFAFILIPTSGCSVLPWYKAPPPDEPLKLLVAQVIMKAPLSSPTDLKSFDKPPPEEEEPILLAQLIEEVEQKAQQLLIEQLAQQPEFVVMPLDKTHQIRADMGFGNEPLDNTQLRAFGAQAGVDVVLSGRILDYGKVQWQYWAMGLAVSMLTETLIVGASTGFNPTIMAIAAASELLTDLPFWWGGAYIAGWAFRPVRIKVKALQITECEKVIWKEEELVIHIFGKSLDKYSPEERKLKEVQLGVNLEESLTELAKSAGNKMRLEPCPSQTRLNGSGQFGYLAV